MVITVHFCDVKRIKIETKGEDGGKGEKDGQVFKRVTEKTEKNRR